MQQSSATPKKRDVGRGVAEDCCILLTLPHSAFLCHLFLARTSYFIFNDFYTNFFCTAQGHVPIIHEHACPTVTMQFQKGYSMHIYISSYACALVRG